MMTVRSFCCAALMAGSLFAGVGCAVIDSHEDTRLSGHAVATETLRQIEPGVTTEAWILATLGEPTSSRAVDDATRILTYASTHTRHSNTTILFLIDASSHVEIDETHYFEVTDGVVTRYWKESRRSDAG